MPSPEKPTNPTHRRSSSGSKQPLVIRLYFDRCLTEVAQLIGYNDVPVDQARERLKPLIERFGKQKLQDAAEELLDVDSGKQPPVARLKAEVAKMAFQLLGPRPPVVPDSPPAAAAVPEVAIASIEAAGAPIKMPRYHVMGKYEEHLAANKLRFTTAAELRKGMPFLEMLPALDYLVERQHMRLLVAVRPNFRGNQAAQLIAYTDALLANHAAVQVWPVVGATGWEWQEHELFAGPLKIDPHRYKLSLDDWRAVHEHSDGDKNCGRDWQTEGCACACCRAARAILTTRTTKRERATRRNPSASCSVPSLFGPLR